MHRRQIKALLINVVIKILFLVLVNKIFIAVNAVEEQSKQTNIHR